MGKNIVVCMDGTGGQITARGSSNAVRLFELLDLGDAGEQIAHYDPGVGTFRAPGAWTPPARWISRLIGLASGFGLRQNLAEAYLYLMRHWVSGDRIFLFGFSRGAYTARALAGLLYHAGMLRPGCDNLVDYVVGYYTRNKGTWSAEDWGQLDRFTSAMSVLQGGSLAVPVDFLGLWDTVKAAGVLRRDLKWPYTRQLPNVHTIWHAASLDERRRPYREYLVQPKAGERLPAMLNEVWFAGVHSDVGGTFEDDPRPADTTLRWMAGAAVTAGLRLSAGVLEAHYPVDESEAEGTVQPAGPLWALLGRRTRTVPEGARIHASLRRRQDYGSAYAHRIPTTAVWEEAPWPTPQG